MRKIFWGIIVLLFIFASCASNRFATAERYLTQQKYELALKEYMRLASQKSSFELSKDIPALTGAMIAYYGLGKYKESFNLSKRILTIDNYNSAAIFYAGLNLEQKQKFSLAKRIYQYYQYVPESDPYYNLIKSRFQLMVEKEMEQRAKMAIKLEKSVGVGQLVDNTLAVLYFANLIEDPRWDAVGKGLAEMMITDFSQTDKLHVIERVQLQKLLDEMQLAMSGLAQPETAPRLGRLVRAQDIVHGGFMIKAGRFLTINSEIIDVAKSSAIETEEFKGELKDIIDIEKKIVFKTLDRLGIELTASQRRRIEENRTINVEAFLEFCKGLDNYDRGELIAALNHFRAALRFDKNFILARRMANQTFSLSFVKGKNVAALHPRIRHRRMGRGLFAGRPGRARLARRTRGQRSRLAQLRLQRMGKNLDFGYRPGNHSRNGNSEFLNDDVSQNLPEWIFHQEILPTPPEPPEVKSPNEP